jgi:hypothetical protein
MGVLQEEKNLAGLHPGSFQAMNSCKKSALRSAYKVLKNYLGSWWEKFGK